MPKFKYRVARDLPNLALTHKTLSPTILCAKLLSTYNVKRTDNAITVWFGRHPDVYNRLKTQIEGAPSGEEVAEEAMYDTKNFIIIPSISDWIKSKRRKERSMKAFMNKVRNFANVLQGIFPRHGVDLKDHGWSLKHPDRFSDKDAILFIDMMKERYPNVDLAAARGAMRSFLQFKNLPVSEISGKKHKGSGNYAKLFYESEIIWAILSLLKKRNFEAYVASKFMFYTGTRVKATLKALVSDIIETRVGGEVYTQITVFDKGSHEKYGEKGHPWDKTLSPDLYEELKFVSKGRIKIFEIELKELTRLNRMALETIIPDIFKKYPNFDDVNHFWRHMFAQHMLRATNWNYAIVANLGGWTIKALEESYGQPPAKLVSQWGREFFDVFSKNKEAE